MTIRPRSFLLFVLGLCLCSWLWLQFPGKAEAYTGANSINLTVNCEGNAFRLIWTQPSFGQEFKWFEDGGERGSLPFGQTSIVTPFQPDGSNHSYYIEQWAYGAKQYNSNIVTISMPQCAATSSPPVSPLTVQLVVTPLCSGSNTVFRLVWTMGFTAVDVFKWYQNGSEINNVVNPRSVITGAATPGSGPYSWFVRQYKYGGVVGTSNTVTMNALPAQNCAAAPPPPPPSSPGPFVVSAQSRCLSPATIEVRLDWTQSANAVGYELLANRAGANFGPAGPRTYVYTLSSGFAPNGGVWPGHYLLAGQSSGPYIRPTMGSGVVAQGPDSFGVQIPGCAPPKPGAFSGTIATDCNGSTPIARLNWTGASGADSYTVYYVINPTLNVPQVASLPATARSFVMSPLQPIDPRMSGLRFFVEARNAGGVSVATIPPAVASEPPLPNCSPQPTITLSAVTVTCSAGSPVNVLNWSSDDGAGGTLGNFSIVRDGIPIGSVAGTSYTDATAVSGTTYSYAVRSGATTSVTQSSGATATCPQAPGSFSLTVSPECFGTASINRLVWTDASNASRYEVQRDGVPLVSLNAPTTTYDDTLVIVSTTYQYSVRAFNAVGARDVVQPVTFSTESCQPPPPVNINVEIRRVTPGSDSALQQGQRYDYVAIVTDQAGQILPSANYSYQWALVPISLNQLISSNVPSSTTDQFGFDTVADCVVAADNPTNRITVVVTDPGGRGTPQSRDVTLNDPCGSSTIGDIFGEAGVAGLNVDERAVVSSGGLINLPNRSGQTLPGQLDRGVNRNLGQYVRSQQLRLDQERAKFIDDQIERLRIEQSKRLNPAATDATLRGGTFNLNPAGSAKPEGSVWYVPGNLVIETPISFDGIGTIIVDGTVKVRGNGSMLYNSSLFSGSPDFLGIISRSTADPTIQFEASGVNDVVGAYFAPRGKIRFDSGLGTARGLFVAKDMEINPALIGLSIQYDGRITTTPPPGFRQSVLPTLGELAP